MAKVREGRKTPSRRQIQPPTTLGRFFIRQEEGVGHKPTLLHRQLTRIHYHWCFVLVLFIFCSKSHFRHLSRLNSSTGFDFSSAKIRFWPPFQLPPSLLPFSFSTQRRGVSLTLIFWPLLTLAEFCLTSRKKKKNNTWFPVRTTKCCRTSLRQNPPDVIGVRR